MDLLAISRRVKSESGRSGSGPVTVAGATDNELRIVNAVRSSWLQLQLGSRNWRWMRKTIDAGVLTQGVMSYAGVDLDPAVASISRWWPASTHYSPAVYDLANPVRCWSLTWVPYDRFRQAFMMAPAAQGAPQYWSIAPDGNLLVAPAPDAALSYRLRIDYKQRPTQLVADGDEPDMPEDFHELLVWQALADVSVNDAAQEQYVRANDRASALFSDLCLSQAEPIEFYYRPLA